jgi:hypothetical protein
VAKCNAPPPAAPRRSEYGVYQRTAGRVPQASRTQQPEGGVQRSEWCQEQSVTSQGFLYILRFSCKSREKESRRADSNRFLAHYELACGYPDACHCVSVYGLPKPNVRPRRRRASHCVPARTDSVAVRLQYVLESLAVLSAASRPCSSRPEAPRSPLHPSAAYRGRS